MLEGRKGIATAGGTLPKVAYCALLLSTHFLATSSAQDIPEDTPKALIKQLFVRTQKSLAENRLDEAASNSRQILGIALNKLGEIYIAFADYPLAERALREALSNPMPSIDALQGLSAVYLATRQYGKAVETVQKILEKNPSRTEAKYLLGMLFFMQGEFESASRELRDLYSASPDNTNVAYTLAIAYVKQNQHDEAHKILQVVEREATESPELYMLLGRAYREARDFDKAIAAFKQVIELDPNFPGVHYHLGLSYLMDQEVAAFPIAKPELEFELKQNPKQYFPNFLLGVVHTYERNHQKAIPYLRRAIALKPGNPDPYLYLGQSLSESDDPYEAIAMLKKSIDLNSDSSRNDYQMGKTYYSLGRTLLNTGNQDEALTYLRLSKELMMKGHVQRISGGQGPGTGGTMVALELSDFSKGADLAVMLHVDPPDQRTRVTLESAAKFYREAVAYAYQYLAEVATRRSDFSSAAELLETAASWDDSLRDLYFNLGLAYIRASRLEEAIAPVKKTLKRNPSSVDSRRLMVHLIRNFVAKRFSELAMDAVIFLGDLDPDAHDLAFFRGQIHAQKGQYADALKEFSTVLEMNPRDTGALYAKASILISERKWNQAIPILETVIRLQPDHADACYQLGSIQLEEGQFTQAVANLETAARLNPSRADNFYQLSRAYTQSSRPDEAEKALVRYRQLKKKDQEKTPD